MTMLSLRSIGGSFWSFWRRAGNLDRAGYTVGALLLTSGLIHVAILLTTGGSWVGPLSLRKPATFGLSFGLTLITIVWVSSFLRLSGRARAMLLGVFTVASVIETALVSLQAWRGVPSHFNMETTLDAVVARTLAVGGITLVVTIVILTRASFRANPEVPPSLRIAIQIGFVVLCGSMAVGALMIAKGMVLVFSGDPQLAYATGGTLKPSHAVTMHGILVLPALAWLLSLTAWTERRRLRVVLFAATGYFALAGVIAVENFVGLELSQPSVVAIALAGLGTLIAAGAIALVASARAPVVDRIARGVRRTSSDA